MLHGQQDRFFKNKNGNENERRLSSATCMQYLIEIPIIQHNTTSKQTNKMTVSIILLLLGILTQKGHP